MGYVPQTISNVWDGLGAAWSIVLAVVGTIYIYHQHGGGGGQHFLQRYFAVGWVVTVRWLVILVLAVVAFYATLAAVGVETENTEWYHFLFLAIAEAVVYRRIGHHVGDLAHRTTAV